MDSSPILRQQSQNKILNNHSSLNRMKLNELNRMTADPKPGSKHPSVPHPSKHTPVPHGHRSKRGTENKDPAAASDNDPKPPVRPLGISRLPVLAKSLPLQTPSDFTQSHKRWEENSLAGKAKRKKPCTKPVPFNFTHPRANRMGTENQRRPLAATSKGGAQPTQPENTFSAAASPKTRLTTTAKLPSSVPATHNKAQTKSTVELAARLPTLAQHLAARKEGPGLAGILSHPNGEGRKTHWPQATSAATSMSLSQHPKPKAPTSSNNLFHGSGSGQLGLSRPPSSFGPGSGLESIAFSFSSASSTTSAKPTALSTEACRGHLDTLSIKDLSEPGQLPSSTAGHVEAFSSDPFALRSILQNIGVNAAGASMSSRPSTQAYNNMPQRVSIMKSQQKTAPSAGPVRSVQFSPEPSALNSILQNEGITYPLQPQRVSIMKSHQKTAASAGPVRSVQFSPDPTALSSILQNEGVTAGGPLGATPQRTSVCPSGRGTSIYTAQRVPVTKSCTEAPGGPMVMPVGQKWTPQRVPDTRHQPMSMRRHLSAHRTPYACSPRLWGLQGHTRDLETHKEVVQRLFKETDQEEELWIDNRALDKDPAETRTDKDQEEEEEQNNTGRGLQTFFQAPHRESVIFFSTGKKLLRVAQEQESPVAGFLERGGPLEQCWPGPRASSQGTVLKLLLHPDRPSSGPETLSMVATAATASANPSAFVPLSHPRGSIIIPKSGALSSAAALLRRRLPPLQELRLDEEVATYTSSPAPPWSSIATISCPLQTRCGNPVAAALYLQDYTSFRSIILDPSSAPSSPCSSPLQER
ncbi:mucin-5AC isoform X2 [Coregonus clupeaformis]|uniref:mucin-5AC isoform X2 n=1 Tax=Coregonus clupeaformis TaxID=59861 RepID=UPI001BE08FE8|nr:mucin-5AC isoform X2 [Coregonus clupeaformis]